ncbi:N-acetyltransferase [Nakamurella antarctica]|uniref:N-acetyltransferase n=1 Tax=Nakamurella antarctica TaxID=1902245 RepID=A0A3G8ZKM1_9ACTN|nr:GNAT family N-acetyltransferase [Nakamurella antarctica]AZI57750.1 N-acetyltransferase [Nakamurella antarctica]
MDESVMLRLMPLSEATWLLAGGRPQDGSWHPEYPLDGDQRACGGYVDRATKDRATKDRATKDRATEDPSAAHPFGYYQVLRNGVVIGGAGFHSPPASGVVEIGYGIVPAERGRGSATAALRMLLAIATEANADPHAVAGVELVIGSADHGNEASQRVMLAAGMRCDGPGTDEMGEAIVRFSWDVPV